MNVEEFGNVGLSLPGVTEKMPFTTMNDPYSRELLCFYIGGKEFCLVNIAVFDRCCVKSSPEEAERLREMYEDNTTGMAEQTAVERHIFRQRRTR